MPEKKDEPAEQDTPRGRGRPRNSDKDRAIREAVWAVLAARGYDNLSFEAVAEIAGVSRSTLYRRFTAKAEMIANAMVQTSHELARATPEETEPRALMLAHVRNMAEYMSGERGKALLGINFSSLHEPDLARAVADAVRDDLALHYWLLRSIHPGASDAAVELAFDILRGTLLFRITTHRTAALGPGELEALVGAAIGALHSVR
jgi:AcrR family transcriptional regulator